ncbi:MAG: putative 2OG-Fe(II) oxygenase, partial [Polymorphobacter sp.]
FENLVPVLGQERHFALAWGRHLLRARAPDRAAAVLAPWTGAGAATDQLAWALLGTAWRLMGDARHDWLVEPATMTRALDLDLGSADLAVIAAVLRRLHKAREHPFDQTLRGGTQTEGMLFLRGEPEIRQLRLAIEAGVRDFIDGLPAFDATHPLLGRDRGGFRFSGAWSVRLRGGGNHVNHIHPAGWLSSACYIALPEAAMGGANDAGWLTFGVPPIELGLELPALAKVEPRPGRLALFPSYLWHGTQAFDDGERLTVAFDVIPQ